MIIGSNNTLHNIILEDIINQIIIDDINPGDKIISVREQAKKYKINPQTVQKAYNILIKEQIIIPKVGSGNYITTDNTLLENLKKDFINNEINKMILIIDKYKIDNEYVITRIKERDESITSN